MNAICETRIIDGAAHARAVRLQVRERVEALRAADVVPGLAVILAGDDPASQIYVGSKARACAEVGVHSEQHNLPASVTEAQLLERVQELNADPRIHAILVQLPLPEHILAETVLQAVAPEKDADGFHPLNAGLLAAGRPVFVPCTPAGIMLLLDREDIHVEGRHAVVVGRSNIVGKPMAMLLLHRNATVTICHSRTRELAALTRQADILVAAVGSARCVTGDMVKPGAVVIDVGMNRLGGDRGGLVGDVDFQSVAGRASYLTPVPKGVGPMTIAMLLENTVLAAERASRKV